MDDNTATPALARIETVARILDCPPTTVRYWIRIGKLPAVKVGKGIRVRMSDVNALIMPQGGAQ